MEHLLTFRPIYYMHKNNNSKYKNKILHKFIISDNIRGFNQLKENQFVKYNTKYMSKSTVREEKKNDKFPLINKTTINNLKYTKNMFNDNIKKRNQSKEELISPIFLPKSNEFKTLKMNKSNIIINDYDILNYNLPNRTKIINNNNKINNSQLYDFLKDINKKELKVFRVNKITNNKITKKFDNNSDNNKQEKFYNPIKINKDNTSIEKNKLIFGSKFRNQDLSPDSISKNLYYSKLNTFFNKINEKIPLKKKKNESRMGSLNNKLKSFYTNKINKYEKLITDTAKEVKKHKTNSLNYIKGSRYEFYCLVRNSKTRHCVIYIKSTLEKCLENNQLLVEPYNKELLEDLFSRMEEPIQSNRWDCPLYMIYPGEEAPYEDICISLFEGKKARDPVSTKPELVFDTNYLFNLNKTCQDVINDILHQQDQNSGDTILKINKDEAIYLNKKFTPVQLKKIKIEFIKISKNHPPKDNKETIKYFSEYIKTIQDRY